MAGLPLKFKKKKELIFFVKSQIFNKIIDFLKKSKSF